MSRYDSRPCSQCNKPPITASASSKSSSHMFCDNPEHWITPEKVVPFEFKTPVQKTDVSHGAPVKNNVNVNRRLTTPKKLDFNQNVHKINKNPKCQHSNCGNNAVEMNSDVLLCSRHAEMMRETISDNLCEFVTKAGNRCSKGAKCVVAEIRCCTIHAKMYVKNLCM